MTFAPKAALLLAVLALAACTNPNKYDDSAVIDPGGAYGAGAGGAYGSGAGNGVGGSKVPLGNINDPNSPAYFNGRVGDMIHFELDQSTLSADAIQTLSGQARWLNAHAQYNAIIEGHADEQGTREYNLALGARRATSAQEYLISQGVAANRLRTVSYGKERPICTDATAGCRSENRRAVTVLTLGGN